MSGTGAPLGPAPRERGGSPITLVDGRIPSLDGLRALSVVMVLLGHASATAGALMHQPFFALATPFIDPQRGVSIFFVISGFLITLLLAREYERAGAIAIGDFYLRRAFRIFPAFYAYWAVVAALLLLRRIELPHWDLIASALYIWNYTGNVGPGWFVGHTWSLSVEEQFYLCWPLLLHWLGLARARTFAVAVLFAAPLLRAATYVWWPGSRPQFRMMLHTRADALMVGALLALVCVSLPHRERLMRLVASSLMPLAVAALLVADSLLLLWFGNAYLFSVGYSLQNASIVLLVAYVVLQPATALGRLLNTRVLVRMGALSYSLYLWQQLFLTPLNTTWTGRFPLNIICAWLAAELSFRLVEQPFLQWRQRWVTAAPAAALEPVAEARRVA